jgi:hypothetical protein
MEGKIVSENRGTHPSPVMTEEDLEFLQSRPRSCPRPFDWRLPFWTNDRLWVRVKLA